MQKNKYISVVNIFFDIIKKNLIVNKKIMCIFNEIN